MTAQPQADGRVELKPCPFCERVDRLTVAPGSAQNATFVMCLGCGASGPNSWGHDDNAPYAIAAWNRRAVGRDGEEDGAASLRSGESQGSHLPASNWQPIETAPKDGTPFLAYVRGEQVVAAWREVWAAGNWELVGILPPPLSETETRTVASLEGKFGGKVMVPGPTHWQPLPSPPAGKDET